MKIVQLSLTEIKKHRNELVSLMRLCFDQSYSSSIPVSFCEEKIAGLESYLRAEKAFIFAAQEQEELLGFLWAYSLDTPVDTRFHVAYFAVIPAHQGRGIGTLLLTAAEEQAKGMGISIMELIVTGSNHGAVAFYVGHGYQTERLTLSKPLV